MQHKQLAILGGDNRYIAAAHMLAETGATVYVCGYDDVSFTNKAIVSTNLSSLPIETIDALILPVLGADESGKIKTHFPADTLTFTDELVKLTKDSCIIFSGVAGPYVKNICKQNNRKLIAYYELDEVAILNAVPTAEATLQIAMEETDFTIRGSTTIVTGFGRIGITIAQLFQQVGAHVIVAGRDEAQLARANTFGMSTVYLEELHTVIDSCDICINTIPALVINENIVQKMNDETIVIDVASKPGGVDFDALNEHNIKTIHALGLPGKVAPKTAGEIIAKTINHYINK